MQEAYLKMKEQMGQIPTWMAESKAYYLFHKNGNGVEVVNKETGELGFIWWNEYMELQDSGDYHPVFVQLMFDDIVKNYDENPSEENLAYLFFTAWNRANWVDNTMAYDENDKNIYDAIKNRWKELIVFFISKIDELVDWDTVEYPVSIKDKLDDDYYRLKPFMVKHGYTTSMHNDRLWYEI